MSGNLHNRLRAGATIAGFWTLEAIYSSAQVVYRTSWSEKPWPWADALRSEFAYAWLGALLTPVILLLSRRYPIDRSRAFSRIALHLLAATAFAFVMKLQWDITNGVVHPSWTSKGLTVDRLLQTVIPAYDLGFVLYWGILLSILAADFYSRYQQSRIESAQLQTELVQSQLHALRAQIDPHFLFNTLHGISELVHSDPVVAERMIAGLSELLRRSLDSAGTVEVTLAEEVAFLEIFLDIERTRFENRLDAALEIDPQSRNALVPAMALQPLVENAIRHGVGRRKTGGRILVRSALAGTSGSERTLILSVIDNGDGPLPSNLLREGVGLRSVRGRLVRLHGPASRFRLERTHEGTEARIEIPYRAAEPPTPSAVPPPEEAYAAR
jgi:LytS/YehU family sensor histidine kinase